MTTTCAYSYNVPKINIFLKNLNESYPMPLIEEAKQLINKTGDITTGNDIIACLEKVNKLDKQISSSNDYDLKCTFLLVSEQLPKIKTRIPKELF
jgi:hypothetical protein